MKTGSGPRPLGNRRGIEAALDNINLRQSYALVKRAAAAVVLHSRDLLTA
jgi:hypothetical protein